jgi:chromate reductase
MDSVGGSDVASGLLSVFSGLGCWMPPCSTVIVSRVAQEAIKASQGRDIDPNDDVWRPEDMKILIENLILACEVKNVNWKAWPHVELNVEDGPWPDSGLIDLKSEKFL